MKLDPVAIKIVLSQSTVMSAFNHYIGRMRKPLDEFNWDGWEKFFSNMYVEVTIKFRNIYDGIEGEFHEDET